MAEHRVTVRVESHIAQYLEEEAKRRRQTVAALVRTFIRDGLARYDAFSDRVLQTQEILQKSQTILESLVGTHLHLSLEASVRGLPRRVGFCSGCGLSVAWLVGGGCGDFIWLA